MFLIHVRIFQLRVSACVNPQPFYFGASARFSGSAMVDRTTYTDVAHTPDLPLRQIFGRQRLPEALCQTVADANLLTVETFSMLGDTIAAVKTTLKAKIPDQTKFGPDEPAQELALASLAAVWKTCSTIGPLRCSACQNGRGSSKGARDPGRRSCRVPAAVHCSAPRRGLATSHESLIANSLSGSSETFLFTGPSISMKLVRCGPAMNRLLRSPGSVGMQRTCSRLFRFDQPHVAAFESQVMDKLHAFFVALEYLNVCEFSYKAGPLQYLSDLEEWRHENRGLALLLAADSLIRKKVYRLNSDRKRTYGTFSWSAGSVAFQPRFGHSGQLVCSPLRGGSAGSV